MSWKESHLYFQMLSSAESTHRDPVIHTCTRAYSHHKNIGPTLYICLQMCARKQTETHTHTSAPTHTHTHSHTHTHTHTQLDHVCPVYLHNHLWDGVEACPHFDAYYIRIQHKRTKGTHTVHTWTCSHYHTNKKMCAHTDNHRHRHTYAEIIGYSKCIK